MRPPVHVVIIFAVFIIFIHKSPSPYREGPADWKLRQMGSQKEYIWTGSFLGSLGLSCRYKRFLSCLGCSVALVQNNFFPHRTLFQFIAQHAGQAAVLGLLSLYVYYLPFHTLFGDVFVHFTLFLYVNTHVLCVITSPMFTPVVTSVSSPIPQGAPPLPPSWLYIDTNYRNCL